MEATLPGINSSPRGQQSFLGSSGAFEERTESFRCIQGKDREVQVLQTSPRQLRAFLGIPKEYGKGCQALSSPALPVLLCPELLIQQPPAPSCFREGFGSAWCFCTQTFQTLYGAFQSGKPQISPFCVVTPQSHHVMLS